MATTPQSGTPPTTDRSRIIELFAKRKPFYALADVLRLTRSSDEEVNAAVNAGALDPRSEGAVLLFTWEDVAILALRRWTPRMIDAALGPVTSAVPRLNRVKHIDVHLPLYQIRMLHVLADTERAGFRGRLNASDIIERLLLDLASSVGADAMDEAIPGFRAALQFPYFVQRDDDWATAFCRFCGRLSGEAGREMCDDCKQRHEPRMHVGEHGVPELDEEE
jgi:hypothetical protein